MALKENVDPVEIKVKLVRLVHLVLTEMLVSLDRWEIKETKVPKVQEDLLVFKDLQVSLVTVVDVDQLETEDDLDHPDHQDVMDKRDPQEKLDYQDVQEIMVLQDCQEKTEEMVMLEMMVFQESKDH